jgi:general secretion pathway protein G
MDRYGQVMRRTRKAFTLIELLVVILILAILAALIVPNIVNRTGDAKEAKVRSDLSTLAGELQRFRLDTGRYPTTEEGLPALTAAPADADGWKGPYLRKALPLDPWKNEYVYEYPGQDGLDFTLMSYGADGQPGGEGEAKDIYEGE